MSQVIIPDWAMQASADVVAANGVGAWGAGMRELSRGAFLKQGLPGPSSEAWRATNTAPLRDVPFRILPPGVLAPSDLASFGRTTAHRAVFVDGVFSEAHSEGLGAVPGLTWASLRTLFHDEGPATLRELLKSKLGTLATVVDHPFAALNGAAVSDGFVVHVGAGVVSPGPLEVLSIMTSPTEPRVQFPRILVVLETGAEFQLIERHVVVGGGAEGMGSTSGVCRLTCPVTEVFIGDAARFKSVRFVAGGADFSQVSHLHAVQGRDSHAEVLTCSLGGALVRNQMALRVAGSGAKAVLNGLTVLGGHEHVDNDTLLDHAAPHTESSELYKGVYADQSRGVFQGTIIVQPGAQKTNAFQANKSLLLSHEAEVRSKPQLKIWADDVRCTHGATVGQLDAEALFYVRSRGIGLDEARQLLVRAMVGELIEGCPVPPFRDYLEGQVSAKLDAINRNVRQSVVD